MTLSGIRRDVFLDRYARKDDDGKAIEASPEQMWDRVAAAIAEVEAPEARAEWTARFRQALDGFKFVPGGRILAGAGTGQKVTFYNCLPPDQPVLTPEGYVPIAEVDARALVITGHGRARMVTQVFAREADEPLYAMRLAGGAGLLRLTGNHPVLVRRGGGAGAAWVRASELAAGDLVGGLDAAGGGVRRGAGDGQAWHVRRDEPVGWSPWGGAQVMVRERRETYVGVAWRAIEALERVAYCGTVYDREVEEDHSFVTAGAIVSNCYVIPSPEDSRRGIMDSVGLMVEIMSRGGGVGVNLSSLRPRGSYVRGVNGTASGPVSWGEVYSTATGAVIQGGCFGPSVRIATDKGLVPAAELADRLERGERIEALTHEGPQPITWAFRNGVKPLLRVTTARGFQVEVTPDHRMGVLRDGALQTVPMRELAVGDEVLTFLGDGAEGHEVALARPAHERSVMSTTLNEAVLLPEHLGEELAYLVGYLHGDGSVHHGRKVNWSAPKAVKMATADDRPEIRQRLVAYAGRLFGIQATIEPGTGCCQNVALDSRVLVHWLEANGLLKAKAGDVRVPEAVMRSPSRVQGAFVAGYFDADGCDRGRKGGYGIDSISLGMLRDLQAILASNGILSHISTTDRSAQGWQTIHRLVVVGAEFKARAERFADMSLKMRGQPGLRNHRNSYPRAVWRSLGVPGRYDQGLWDSTKPRISYRALSRVRDRLIEDGQLTMATAVQTVLSYVPDRITTVEFLGMSEAYDFEVAETHMLSGSGFYTSNSRRGALMLMIDDDHPDVEEFVTVKKDLSRINNANLSVCVSDRFMEAVKNDGNWELQWEGKVYKTIRARDLWNLICESAWASGEPGVVFMERYQKWSNTWYCEQIRCVNPCFVGSTRIATSRGLVTAEELYQTQERLSVVTDLRAVDEVHEVVGGVRHSRFGVTTRSATPVFKTRENAPVMKLVTSHGLEVTATPDHRFLTPTGYVRLDDLQAGDVVYLQSGEGGWATDRRLPVVDWGLTDRGLARLRAKVARGEAQPPTEWSADLGRFLGWVVADGYTYNHHGKPSLGMVFGEQEQYLMPYFRDMLQRWFGVAGTVATRNHTTALMYDANVARFALDLGLSPNGGLANIVPSSIWNAPRDTVIGFLQGLFTADGTVNVVRKSRYCSVRLASSSRALLADVQSLLLNLGIVSNVYLRRAGGSKMMPDSERQEREYAIAAQYELVITRTNKDRFLQEIGFLSEAKQTKLTAFLEEGSRGSYGETFTTKVKAVEPAGSATVYDVTVKTIHSVIISGLLSHNCGEQGLGPWGVCNLGAINIAAFVKHKKFDWDALRETVATATRFLDNVIEATEYYFEENEQQQRYGIRRTGLGSMGLADALIQLELRYGSPEAIEFCDRLYATVRDVAYRTSAEIAAVKGPFPAYDRDQYQEGHFIKQLPADVRELIAKNGIRNGVLLTQAPTGTTSLLAGVSSGIEPVYAFSFKRVDRTGTHVVYHELYQQWVEQHPDEPAPPYFVSADQLTPEEHVRMQAAIQSYVDASISKTVNAPNSHTIDEVKTLYTLAYELGCKGVTYFRDGCRAGVLTKLEDDKPKAKAQAAAEDDDVFPLGHKVNGRWGHIRPIERPERLVGFTDRKQTPLGTLFLTLNTLDGHPVELFATIGKAGSDVSAFTEGIARLVSVALRSGVDPAEVANQLKGIGGSRSVGFGPGRVRSVPDAMGQFIDEILQEGDGGERPAEGKPPQNGHGRRGTRAVKPVAGVVAPEVVAAPLGEGQLPVEAAGAEHVSTFNLCPACGLHTLAYIEGCALCFSCGYSEC